MPVYYFHLRNGEDLLLDPDGRELACLRDVAFSALKEARSLISGDALDGHIDLDYQIDVQDASGNTVHSLPFGDAVAIHLAEMSVAAVAAVADFHAYRRRPRAV